jgi:Tfp pilus assembly protein PilF/transglutaminase-like putative cysteine protease
LNAALRLDPNDGPTLIALANYYSGRGQLEKARDLLRKAIQSRSGDFVARNTLIDLYVAVGLNAEALQQSRQLAQEYPNPLWLKRRLAARFLDQRQLQDAATLLQSALPHDFDNAQTRALLLRLYELQRNTIGLRGLYADMLRLRPTDTAVLTQLAALDAGQKDFSSAQEVMRKAMAIAPEDDDLHVSLADLLQRAGEGSSVQEELAAALKSNPNREDVRQRMELMAAGKDQSGDEAEYLENPAELATAAQRTPPSAVANAITLADVRVEQVRDNGLSTVREQQIYYIANQQGARTFSTRNVQYAPGSQQLRILHARVYKRNGQVLEAEEAGEGGVADTNVAMYYDVRSRTLRYPALEPGDVVELDYRISPTTKENPYGDYFGGLVVFRSKLPEQLQRYVLITPAERRFNVLEQRMEPARVTMRGDQRVYKWEARNQQALSSEPRGPALTDIAPYVHVSTFQSWEELGRWYSQLIAPQFALDGALRDAYKSLLKDAHTEQERISAIHQFVLRNTHYVAMEFGIYSYKPYRVSQVYARRFGDCKDKASLMIALLRNAGIEADIALVRTRRLGAVDPRATSIAQFNHAIVYLPKYKLWLDGTAEYSGSTELPLDDQGATALTVAAEGTATLRQIPVTQPGDNYTRRTVRAQVRPDGHIVFTGVAYTRGEDAPGLRREYESPERQRDAVQNSLAQIFPSVLLDHVQVQGANDLEHPVTVEFRGEVNTFAGQVSIPLAASWMPRSYVQQLAALTSRTEDLLLPAPWTTEEELHFELPDQARVRMPSDTILNTPYGTARLQYVRNGRELVVRTSVQFRKLRISPEEYGQFRDFCQQIERAFHDEIKVELRG